MFRNYEYAVVDVETTGFSPAVHDRVIEIGISRVDSANNTISEYATLINPNRDIGPTHIHGITARDVVNAPCFDEVVGDVLAEIKGAILVAHNASFDLRFLTHECGRCGTPLPPVMSLCTLSLSRKVCPDVPSRKLSALCDYFGIELGDSHSALDDARATACLLATCFGQLKATPAKIPLEALGAKGSFASDADWPAIPRSRRQFRRSHATLRQKPDAGRLNRLFESLPPQNSTNNSCEQYLEVLERALEDRQISDDEVAALQEVATELDMDQEEVRKAHRLFLRDLVRVALLDDIITDLEQRDIEEVAALLGISTNEHEAMAEEAKAQGGQLQVRPVGPGGPLEGKEICFTGSFNSLVDGERVTRSMMEEIATCKGMVVRKNVTRSLDYLVCADPDTMSGKAKKAREYGVRIIAEPAFFRMISA
jgi:DNA polymerase-3 subunit epsilon